jgi:hypothetical protein
MSVLHVSAGCCAVVARGRIVMGTGTSACWATISGTGGDIRTAFVDYCALVLCVLSLCKDLYMLTYMYV